MDTVHIKAISPGNRIANVILVFQVQNTGSLFSTQSLLGTTMNKFIRNYISVIFAKYKANFYVKQKKYGFVQQILYFCWANKQI